MVKTLIERNIISQREHWLDGKNENLTGEEFNAICVRAEEIYYDSILIGTEPGVA